MILIDQRVSNFVCLIFFGEQDQRFEIVVLVLRSFIQNRQMIDDLFGILQLYAVLDWAQWMKGVSPDKGLRQF